MIDKFCLSFISSLIKQLFIQVTGLIRAIPSSSHHSLLCSGWRAPPSHAVSQKSSLLSCCAHLKGHGQSEQMISEPRPTTCIITPCYQRIPPSRATPMTPNDLQGKLGHVAVPLHLETENVIGKYLARLCHSLHLSCLNTHLTLPHKHCKHSCSLQGGQHKATQCLLSSYLGDAWSFPACKTANPSLSSYVPCNTQPICMTKVLFPIPPPRAHQEHALPSKCSPEPIILPNNFLILCHPLTK